MHTDTRNQ